MYKKRDDSIDIAKGIGIFLMVVGHTTSNKIILQWIYSFHMPLFFFLSGVFHSQGKNYKEFVIKKIKTLLVPYFFFSIILFLFFFIVSRNIGFSAGESLSVKENFIGIFLGNEMKGTSQMSWGGQLWFLPALFLVENIYYFFYKFKEKIRVILIICCLILNVFLSKHTNINIPWSWLTVLVAINFYTCGQLLRGQILNTNKLRNIYLIMLLVSNLIIGYFNSKVDMYFNNYGNIFLFLIASYSGIIFLIFFVKNFIKKSKIFEYIGKNSLIILAFHRRVQTFTKILFIFLLQKEILEGNIIFDLLYSCWEILLCIPAVMILNKCFPYLIGKKIRREKNVI